MPSSFAVRTGLLRLKKTPNARQRAQQRRLMAICAMLALALASGVIGMLATPHEPASPQPATQTGPFSYFPTQ
jgi:hypothetical protein